MDGDHVWLAVPGAAQAAEVGAPQDVGALLTCEVVNQHGVNLRPRLGFADPR